MKSLAVALLGTILISHATWGEEAQSAQPPVRTPSEQSERKIYVSDPVLSELDVLFRLQDAAARGQADAANQQKQMLIAVGAKLMTLENLEGERIAPYVAGYVLSGGDPQTAERLSKIEGLPPSQRQLLEGAAAFMKGEREKAVKELAKLDPFAWPHRVAGRLALAQALLTDDAELRQEHLVIAMSTMPGTLIEESALRRSALSYAETRNESHFWKRLDRYQRRFPDSLYAAGFWDEVLRLIVIWHAGGGNVEEGEGIDTGPLDIILSDMVLPRRRNLYLALAQQAASANNVKLTEFAAHRLLRLSVSGSLEEQVARLYLALYSVATENGGEVRARLLSINPALLNTREAALLAAGLSVTNMISEEPVRQPDAAADKDLESSPQETRAERLLEDTDHLVGDGRL